jgi:DME family drug/metabolite transporter
MGELAALGTALLWATSSTLVGTQTARVPTTVISAVQLLAATLLLWILTGVLLAAGAIEGTTLPQGLFLIATALVGPGLGDMLYFAGIRVIGLARAFPVSMAGSPLFTIALAALLIGEAITLPVVAGAVLTIGGIYLIATRGWSSSAPASAGPAYRGLLIVLLASFFWAVSTVSLRVAADGVAAPIVSSIRIPAAALLALALARGTGRSLHPAHYGARSMLTLTIAGLLGVGTSLLYVLAIQQTGAARTAILSSTAPLFALPLAALVLRERITRRVAAGTLLSIAGIWLVTV